MRRFGRIRYARFYRNRAIRLVPALLFLLLGFTVAEGVFNVSDTRDLGCGGLLFLTFLPDAKDNILMYLLGGPIIGLCTVLVIWKVRDWSVVPPPARPLVWLGIVSYAAYLWNYPISWWLMDGGFGAGWQFAAIALTLVAAVVSWHLVETPINRLRARFEATPRQPAVPPKLSTPAI